MKLGMIRNIVVAAILTLTLTISLQAQQDTSGVHASAGQASQPEPSSNGPDARAGADLPSGTQSPAPANGTAPDAAAPSTAKTASADDNPYDPVLEPPPLPPGKATLIGGIATSVDHVRNRITLQPFGGGPKVKLFVDERSHIYRNGVETTVLGVHKGDRVYVDTLLDRNNNKIFAKNLRVITETGLAEVRGQVIATRPDKGVITLRDQLSAKPVSFSVGGVTSYSSSKGTATAADVQPGALIDVQFSPKRGDRDMAREIVIIARPGDDYVFSGVVTHLDLRSDSMFVDNKSDEQNYELHFTPADVTGLQQLKVGSKVTARAVFDGKQYKASNVRVNGATDQANEQSKAQ
jgi:hypothetical protein